MTQLDELAREERRAYFKAWRAKNPEKVKRHNDNYWQKRAERKLQGQQKSEAQEDGLNNNNQ